MCAPLLCWVTPRKEEDPRVNPGLVRRMAMTSSAIGTVSRRSSSAVYLQCEMSLSIYWISETSQLPMFFLQFRGHIQTIQQRDVSANMIFLIILSMTSSRSRCG